MFNGSTETKGYGFRNFQVLAILTLHSLKNYLTKEIHTRNTVTSESNSLRCLGPHIWNTYPENIKEITSFEKSKESINNWYGPSCKCSLYYYQN